MASFPDLVEDGTNVSDSCSEVLAAADAPPRIKVKIYSCGGLVQRDCYIAVIPIGSLSKQKAIIASNSETPFIEPFLIWKHVKDSIILALL